METIFGEIVQADAVVVAVGLSMGGRISVGRDEMRGGRYGEPDSEGLRSAIERLGLEFQKSVLEVGPRISARDAMRDAMDQGWLVDTEVLVPIGPESAAGCWPAGDGPLVTAGG